MSNLRTLLRDALAQEPNVELALLFGSRARGVARADSDVDLAVLGRGIDRLALVSSLSATVGMDVDVVDLADASIPMLEELVRDGVVVHEASPSVGALWRSRALAQLETDRPWYSRMRDAWLAHVAVKGIHGQP